MFIVCWSPKGGSGTSVIAASLALRLATDSNETLLVDAIGDLGLVLGMPRGETEGLSDWLAAPADVSADALSLLEVSVAERLSLLTAGTTLQEPCEGERIGLAAELLSRSARTVVVDAGSRGVPDHWLVAAARSVMMVRCCYLGITAAMSHQVPKGSSIVVIEEPGRALRLRDVEAVFRGHKVMAVPWDPAVARAVDSGLLVHRMPRSLQGLVELADE